MHIRNVLFFTALLLGTPVTSAQPLNLTRVAVGLNLPIAAMTAPDANNRLFIVEQHTGQIRTLDRTTTTFGASPFLNLGYS